MAARRLAVTALAVTLAAAAICQEAPGQPQKTAPSPQALAWDKDFDLLLEEANVPTRGQVALEKQLASLVHDRDMMAKREASLRQRLQEITGNFTLTALAQELGRQGVSDERTARENLRRQIAETEKVIGGLDEKIKDVKERIAR